jgi:hypothetical protein
MGISTAYIPNDRKSGFSTLESHTRRVSTASLIHHTTPRPGGRRLGSGHIEATLLPKGGHIVLPGPYGADIISAACLPLSMKPSTSPSCHVGGGVTDMLAVP